MSRYSEHPPACTCADCCEKRLKKLGIRSRNDRQFQDEGKRSRFSHHPHKSSTGGFSFIKLFIQILVFASVIGICLLGYFAFSHKITPSIGAISFLSTICIFIILIKLSHSRRYRWKKPSFTLVFWSGVGIILICTFAGIQPLSDYKDSIFTWVSQEYNNFSQKPPTNSTVASVPSSSIQTNRNSSSDDNWISDVRQSLFPTDEEIQSDAFKIVNDARMKAGLSPLKNDAKLAALAKEHCVNMQKLNILSHDGFDSRMRRSSYSYVGENVAEGYHSAQSLVDGWLSSPGHRKNIMDPNFRYAGLAYVDGWADQMFAGF
jgi:uncharacterized protein YkwD